MISGTRLLAVAAVLTSAAACAEPQPVQAKSPAATARPADSPAPADAPSAPTPGVSPELDGLLANALRRDPRSTGQDWPGCPPLSAELKQGVAREVEKSSAVRAALAYLDPSFENVTMFDAVAELQKARAAFTLAAAVCHDSDDVKIRSANALAALADPAPLPFLLDVARKFAVFESGSENATLHGVIQHALAAALNAMTGQRVSLRDGQDPDGLRAGIDVWKTARAR